MLAAQTRKLDQRIATLNPSVPASANVPWGTIPTGPAGFAGLQPGPSAYQHAGAGLTIDPALQAQYLGQPSPLAGMLPGTSLPASGQLPYMLPSPIMGAAACASTGPSPTGLPVGSLPLPPAHQPLAVMPAPQAGAPYPRQTQPQQMQPSVPPQLQHLQQTQLPQPQQGQPQLP